MGRPHPSSRSHLQTPCLRLSFSHLVLRGAFTSSSTTSRSVARACLGKPHVLRLPFPGHLQRPGCLLRPVPRVIFEDPGPYNHPAIGIAPDPSVQKGPSTPFPWPSSKTRESTSQYNHRAMNRLCGSLSLRSPSLIFESAKEYNHRALCEDPSSTSPSMAPSPVKPHEH